MALALAKARRELGHGDCSQDVSRTKAGEPTLAEKVAFLSQPAAYPRPVSEVIRRETHMSWVFLAGDKVYKLKKPVRFPYLDFSTLGRREAACRAELDLNRRLAPDVYLDVVPLVAAPRGSLDWRSRRGCRLACRDAPP